MKLNYNIQGVSRNANLKKKYCKIYKITKITLGSACNPNGHNKNC